MFTDFQYVTVALQTFARSPASYSGAMMNEAGAQERRLKIYPRLDDTPERKFR
jgi:hypothetical protein